MSKWPTKPLFGQGTQLPLDSIVSYIKQVAETLQYAHQEKLVHRDIKPENMLLRRNNEVLLGDFGNAVVIQSTLLQQAQDPAGTIAYMAPEQIRAQATPASDQYALGSLSMNGWVEMEREEQESRPELNLRRPTSAICMKRWR